MEWPSERVSPGGIFHPAKSRCTMQTRQYIKELVDESKLQIAQRQKNYVLRTGTPLPPLHIYGGNPYYLKPKLPKVVIRPGSSRRKSLTEIANSGAYRPERFVPGKAPIDREHAKKHLQEVMAYGKDAQRKDSSKAKPKRREKEEHLEENRYDQLIREIKERQDWVEQMEQLDSSENYKAIINQQIQSKLREIEKLKVAVDEEQT